MSCRDCIHAIDALGESYPYNAKPAPDYDEWHDSRQMCCRLYPRWIDVRGDHICGQQETKYSMSLYDIDEMGDRNRKSYSDLSAAKKRAKDAEAKLKEARATIRDLKAKL